MEWASACMANSVVLKCIMWLAQPGYYKLYTPLPFDLPSKSTVSKKIYLGIDAENSYDFYWLFNQYAQVEEIGLTWFDIFLNKFAFSQPQLLYFFKSGFAGHFNALWKWPNIYTSNINLLQKYSIDLLKSKNNSMNKFVFYLTELENSKEKKFITQYNKNKNSLYYLNELKKNDLYLAQIIGGLLFSGNKNITLLPYVSEKKDISFYNFYSHNIKNKNFSLYENILPSTNVYTPQIGCHLKVLDFNYDKNESKLINKLKYGSEFVLFDAKYEFYIKSKIRESFLCYFNDSSTFFIVKNYSDFNPSNFNYGENFAKVFQPYIEKNSYKKIDKTKRTLTYEKNNEIYVSEFFKRFKVYKIEKNPSKLSLLQNNQEKEYFLKNYGNNIINEMYNYSSK